MWSAEIKLVFQSMEKQVRKGKIKGDGPLSSDLRAEKHNSKIFLGKAFLLSNVDRKNIFSCGVENQNGRNYRFKKLIRKKVFHIVLKSGVIINAGDCFRTILFPEIRQKKVARDTFSRQVFQRQET